jgi:hypothetical protein
MQESLVRKIRYLESANVGALEHSQRGLLDHLLGTRQLLVDWGARPTLRDAGLFHSVYGTEHYEPSALPISRRAEVQKLIGDEAEFLAWLFCFMRRETFDDNLNRGANFAVEHRLTKELLPLSAQQFADLVNLTFANTLDAFPRLSWRLPRACRAYLKPFRSLAMPSAQRALDGVSRPWWQIWK